MRLEATQQLGLHQKMILAPRMIQSMEILQLPVLALQERIQQELEENPVLQVVEKTPTLASHPAPETDSPRNGRTNSNSWTASSKNARPVALPAIACRATACRKLTTAGWI
jgi:DNA-directed RNA polymerase specialized sigma54-like protein